MHHRQKRAVDCRLLVLHSACKAGIRVVSSSSSPILARLVQQQKTSSSSSASSGAAPQTSACSFQKSDCVAQAARSCDNSGATWPAGHGDGASAATKQKISIQKP